MRSLRAVRELAAELWALLTDPFRPATATTTRTD